MTAGSRPRDRPELSVVTPAYNQAGTIAASLRQIAETLDGSGIDYELILVSDGSSDGTVIEAARRRGGRTRVVHYDRNQGKGFALRTGSTVARGDYVAWIDSDLDLDPDPLKDFLARARAGDLDVVVGSKRHPESRVHYPARRRLYSWMYQQLVRALFRLDVRDTQVGLKLFRREALEAALPAVLVKRYAFDLEVLVVCRRFGFPRIEEHPIELNYRFSGSGVGWQAIAHALWDTAAVFYRARIRRYYDRRRALAERVAAHRDAPEPSLTIVIAADEVDGAVAAGLARVREGVPATARVILVSARSAHDGPPVDADEHVLMPDAGADERMAAGARRATTDVVAFIAPSARPSDTWAESALSLMRDPEIGAVVGPVVPRLTGSPRADAAGILSESRMGVGGARVRAHVGGLREVDAFPATNLFIRTGVLHRALDDGTVLDDQLCAVLRTRHGLTVVCHPEAAVTMWPPRLFRPHVSRLHELGVARGAMLRPSALRLRHLAPVGLVVFLGAGPAAVLAGGAWRRAWGAALGAYLAALCALGGVTVLLHRRLRIAGLVVAGAAASHVGFGAGLLRGALRRRRPRDDGAKEPTPAGSRSAPVS